MLNPVIRNQIIQLRPSSRINPIIKYYYSTNSINNNNNKNDLPPPTTAPTPTRDISQDKALFGSISGFIPIDPKITNMDGMFVGGFRINGKKILGPVLLTKNMVLSWKGTTNIQSLQASDLQFLSVLDPIIDLVLIGTGKTTIRNLPLEREVRKFIPIDFLDSFNAGATFNLLMAEERNVAALLFPLTKTK
jgi:NADH dehydrogenase [ubiquinone] 1 alpha subcomplex assembly factor 3